MPTSTRANVGIGPYEGFIDSNDKMLNRERNLTNGKKTVYL